MFRYGILLMMGVLEVVWEGVLCIPDPAFDLLGTLTGDLCRFVDNIFASNSALSRALPSRVSMCTSLTFGHARALHLHLRSTKTSQTAKPVVAQPH